MILDLAFKSYRVRKLTVFSTNLSGSKGSQAWLPLPLGFLENWSLSSLCNFLTRGPKSPFNTIFGICRAPSFILDCFFSNFSKRPQCHIFSSLDFEAYRPQLDIGIWIANDIFFSPSPPLWCVFFFSIAHTHRIIYVIDLASVQIIIHIVHK